MKRSLFAVALALLIPTMTSRSSAAELALGGRCAVCLVEMGQAVAGSESHTVVFDRQTYRFPSDKEKQMFVADPAKYAPALGGDCVVCRVNMGVRMPGKPEFAKVHDGRAYLFPSAAEREAFQSDPKKYESVDLGLGGYCPVCAVMAAKWMPGKPEFTSVYDGVRYRFPSAEERRTFDADPAKFVPALAGDCVVCMKDGDKHVAGSLNFSIVHQGRFYLFPDDAARDKFRSAPATYADADVAQSGHCVVCAKMMNQTMPGKPEFASVYKERRYLFPSAKERDMFNADPPAFLSPADKVGVAPAAEIQIVGQTACAGCAYGVKPLADAESMGLAVVTDAEIYVVEQAETLYPQLFEARFNAVTVELRGTVKQRQGKFVWVEPTTLSQKP